MKIWDRKNKEYIDEKETMQKGSEFLYNTVLGRIFLKTIFVSGWFSNIISIYQKSSLSKSKIVKFIKDYNIEMDKYNPVKTYNSFRDFFVRKREVLKYISDESMNNENLIAIADSKLSVYQIDENCYLKIKNSIYSVEELIQDKELSEKYKNGLCLVFRLSLHDYHRYQFLDNGEYLDKKEIRGELHTVRSISEKHKVFSRNTRIINILNTENFGEVIQVEVGAMMVGKIENHDVSNFSKLQEKGFFDFGGSTIVLLFGENKIEVDKDILDKNTNEGIEVKVEIGMKIGKSKRLN